MTINCITEPLCYMIGTGHTTEPPVKCSWRIGQQLIHAGKELSIMNWLFKSRWTRTEGINQAPNL
jgi:hypothetical protein